MNRHGYGVCKWTCGECGDSYQASGVVGDIKINQFARQHREMHRLEKMSPEERQQKRQVDALIALKTLEMHEAIDQ